MITLYEKLETDFQHNGIGSLDDSIIDPKIKWIDNGLFSLEFEYPLFAKHGLEIENSSIIKASDPEMDNLFFVYKIIPSMGYMKVYCYQVFYKLAFNSINDTNVVSKNGQGALTQLSGVTQYSHKFKFTSDISKVANSRVVRKNPVEILLDSNLDNSFVNRWGGHIVRHGFNISMNQAYGSNKGYSIRHKKDLIGYEATLDETSVVTRIRPVGYDGLLLPEIYVDSPLIDHYPEPRIQEYEYSDVKVGDGEGEFATKESGYVELRRLASLEYSSTKVDVPQGVYKIDFVNLKDTEEYKNFAPLKQILPGDIVTVTHEEDGINITAQMVEYEWNPLSKSYSSITLGNYERTFTSTVSKVEKIQNDLKEINNQMTLVYTAANGNNQVFVGSTEPNIDQNSAEGDLWFKKNGDKTELWILRKVNSELQWVVEISDATQEELRAEIKSILTQADIDRKTAEQNFEQAVTDAKQYTEVKAQEFDTQIATVNQEIIAITTKADNAIRDAGFATTTANDAKQLAESLESTANSAFAKANELAIQVSGYEIQLDGFTQTINDYEGQVSQFSNTVTGLNQTIASYQTDVQGYKQQVSTLDNTVKGFNTTVANYESQVSGYSTKVVSLENTVTGFNSTVAAYKQDVASYSSQLSTLNNTVSGFNSTVASYRTDVQGYTSQVSTLQNTSSGLIAQVEKVQTDFDNLEIGGRNLLLKTMGMETYTLANNLNINVMTNTPDVLISGETYTLSFDLKADSLSTSNNLFLNSGIRISKMFTFGTEWTRQYATFVYNGQKYLESQIYPHFYPTGTMRKYVRNFKLEKGNKATDYSPAPEDMATSAQLTLLSNNINARIVDKGQVVAQFNMDNGTTLFQNGKIILDANTYTMGTTFANDIKAKSLDAVYADIATLKTKVLTTDVITSGMLKSDTALIDKIFATDANVQILTAKTAFINSVKAIDIAADRITAGTLNAARVTIINLDASRITSGTLNAIDITSAKITNNFDLPYNSTRMTGAIVVEKDLRINYAISSSGDNGYTYFRPDGISSHTFNISGTELWSYNLNSSGLSVSEGVANASYRSSSIEFKGAGDFPTRLEFNNERVRVELSSYNGVGLGSRVNGTYSSRLAVGGGTSGIVAPFVDVYAKLNMQLNIIDNASTIYLKNSVGSTSGSRLYNSNDNWANLHGRWGVTLGHVSDGGDTVYARAEFGVNNIKFLVGLNMNGNAITNQSDGRYKTGVTEATENSLLAISRWKFVDYYYTEADKPKEKQFGLIAQDTPEIALFDKETGKWSVNTSRQVMVNSQAIQQLNQKVVSIASLADASNSIANQALSETQQLKQEIQDLKQKIQELESAA